MSSEYVKTEEDGNCLFRCFSIFVYGNQNFHKLIRLHIVDYIFNDWENYKICIIGNNHYRDVHDKYQFKNYMGKNRIHGTYVEIQVFSLIYNVFIRINVQNQNYHNIGNSLNKNKLYLFYKGDFDNGHYDVESYEKDYSSNNQISDISESKNFTKNNEYISNDDSACKNFKRKKDINSNSSDKRLKVKDFEKNSKVSSFNLSNSFCENFSKNENFKELVFFDNNKINDSLCKSFKKKTDFDFDNNKKKLKAQNSSDDFNLSVSLTKPDYSKLKNLEQKSLVDIQKEEKNKNSKYYKIALLNKSEISELLKTKKQKSFLYSNFGEMNYKCKYCSALYWSKESFKKLCCNDNTVSIPPLSPYNNNLKKLITKDSDFRKMIRYYNNSFSFATFGARYIYSNTQQIYNLKIQGEVHHVVPNTLEPLGCNDARNGQIYIYDTNTSIQKRLDYAPQLNEKYLNILTPIMNKNPYSKKYKCLKELSQKCVDYKLFFLQKNKKLKHNYNKPLTSECGAIIVSKSGMIGDIDLCVYPREKIEYKLIRMHFLSQHLDPMIFPIFFPNGDLGWSTHFKKKENSKKNITALQFYNNRLAFRLNEKFFNPLLYGGRLTQQYFLHAYVRIESNRMNFFKKNQKKLRVACYQGLYDHVYGAASNNSEKVRLGNISVLPSTYIGSPRYMQQYYQDAMAQYREIGRPDLFITFTCNPQWPELQLILDKFPSGTTPNDIPNITVRLFRVKFIQFLKDIEKNKIFGTIIGYVYSIEFQKRGLAHAHLIVTLNFNEKLKTSSDIDRIISAEIPENDSELKNLVIKHMLHGPHKPSCSCLITKDEKTFCTKNFPKKFSNKTTFLKEGYPEYRRRNNIKDKNIYNTHSKDKIFVYNSMVVPYNGFCLKKYNCHINVEYCASITCIKYIFNYISKGSDRAFCKIKGEDTANEIDSYIDGRYVSPMEAAWRILKFPLCGRSHTIVRLAVHTENQQILPFIEKNEKKALENWETTLTAWFDLNKRDLRAKNYTYSEIPKHYNWDKTNKKWTDRVQEKEDKIIGRMNIVSPKDSERFYLKLVLSRIKGALHHVDLRTFKGKVYSTYKETAIEMELIKHDSQIFKIFDEAVKIMLPSSLRNYFAWFLMAEDLPALKIWNIYKEHFSHDLKNENLALIEIDKVLKKENFSVGDFGLPIPNYEESENEIKGSCNKEKYKKKFEKMYNDLNKDQKNFFEKIIKNKNQVYFIDGPGGCGKTFLHKTLIYYYFSIQKKTLSMAWTGIASILLPKGMTSHKTFNLPLDLANSESIFFKSEASKKKLKEVDVIIWDEASMIPKKAIELVNKTLQDINENSEPFGEKLVIFGGDFRQILPVVKNGSEDTIVEETIKYSELWSKFTVCKLHKNMRNSDTNFSKLLLDIGENKIKSFVIPNSWKTPNVCNKIYKNINNEKENCNKVILTSHNEYVKKLNKSVLELLNTEEKIYYSTDYATCKGVDKCDEKIYLKYPQETLNKIREGLPDHKLVLKKNAIVMLIRNLSISDGLCNGTRLKIVNLHNHSIECKIITGDKKNNIVFIPRITLCTTETSSYPFTLYRKQFPLVLAFAMTINKSQGQSFDCVGLYIDKPLFSHGQLYVALSRCKNSKKIFIENKNSDVIANVVWEKIFQN